MKNTLCIKRRKEVATFISKFFTENKILLFLLATYILFHPFFERIITVFLIQTFFQYLVPSLLGDFLWIIGLIIIIVRTAISWQKNEFISTKLFLISTLIILFWAYYRFIFVLDCWVFSNLYLVYQVKYIDILAILFSSNIIIKALYRKKQYETTNGKGFCFDNPICEIEDDCLERKDVAKKIAEKIQNTANRDSSFAIGIHSEWGQGKTSFLNLIEKNLPLKDRIIIRFNPWLNNDEKSIIVSFFDALSTPLRIHNSELSSDLLKYAKALLSIGTEESSKLSNDIFSFFKSEKDLRNRFDDINNAIKESGLQIVIFIDDLDRLYENEILEVLRLIRNSANFSNTVFIVAYDRSYIISAIKRAIDYHPNFYLEKIFQVEFTLPNFEDSIIKDKIRSLLSPYLEDDDKKQLQKILNNNLVYDENHFDCTLLTNMRDVSRFVNSVSIAYEALKHESVLSDILNLELLRVKYLGVYRLLATDYNQFLTQKMIPIHGMNFLTIRNNQKGETNQITGEKKTEIEAFLSNHCNDVGIEENQIKDVLKYLDNIFHDYSELYTRRECTETSIQNPIGIDRYFHYKLISTDLSEVEFATYRRKGYNEFEKKIKEWINPEQRNAIARKLENIKFYESRDDYENIMSVIFFFASQVEDSERRPEYVGFNGSNILNKLNFENISQLYDSEDLFNEFVNKLFRNQDTSSLFTSDFICYMLKSFPFEWNFSFSREDIITIQLDLFKRYSSSTQEFDYKLYSFLENCISIKTIKTDDSTKIISETNPKAKELFKECAQRLPEEFLRSIIHQNVTNTYCIDQYYVLKVWITMDEFETFLNNLDQTNFAIIEFKDFFLKCKAKGFSFIEYQFSHITTQYPKQKL